MPENTSQDGGFACIDGMRGLAALGVAIYHVRVALWVGSREILAQPENHSLWERITAWAMAPAMFFDAGVMWFFVISGFCIHFPEAKRRLRGETFRFDAYLCRRWLRLYPPYLAAILLTLAAELGRRHITGEQMSQMDRVVATLGMVQNHVAPGGQLSANPSLWSLPVEMELYLAYPLLILLTGKRGFSLIRFLIVATISLLTTVLANRWAFLSVGFLRFWGTWAAGALLAEWVARRRLPAWNGFHWLAAALALGGGMLASMAGWVRWANLFYGVCFFFVAWFGLWRESAGALRSAPTWIMKGLSFLGRISYSLYLTHFPLFALLGALWIARFEGKPVSVLVPTAALGLAILAAALFFQAIEAPSHRLARWGSACCNRIRGERR